MNTTAHKHSRQRDRIYSVLQQTHSHPTAEWVFERVRAEMPRISLGTVYRNLHVLRDMGKVLELDFGEGTKRYDGFVHDHYHFVCDRCGAVKDLEIPELPDINDRVQAQLPERIRAHRLHFYGTCTDCQAHA